MTFLVLILVLDVVISLILLVGSILDMRSRL